MKTYLAALLALSLGACSSISDSTWFFQGQVDNLGEPAAEASGIGIEVIASGVVAITGNVVTQCWADGVVLDGDRRGRTLILNIGRIGQEPCLDEREREHRYLGIFSGLRGSEYTFRVVNEMGATPVVEMETTLNVE